MSRASRRRSWSTTGRLLQPRPCRHDGRHAARAPPRSVGNRGLRLDRIRNLASADRGLLPGSRPDRSREAGLRPLDVDPRGAVRRDRRRTDASRYSRRLRPVARLWIPPHLFFDLGPGGGERRGAWRRGAGPGGGGPCNRAIEAAADRGKDDGLHAWQPGCRLRGERGLSRRRGHWWRNVHRRAGAASGTPAGGPGNLLLLADDALGAARERPKRHRDRGCRPARPVPRQQAQPDVRLPGALAAGVAISLLRTELTTSALRDS